MDSLTFEMKPGNLFQIWKKTCKYNNNLNLRCVSGICLSFICGASAVILWKDH